ncbi:MAG: LPS export ABC transporter permease LptG, partial [Candidatus Competibacteraceae bacterium]|nr:LPS export ABC transporter permease LptG [Candidatus Competibacteraceae bacterium]
MKLVDRYIFTTVLGACLVALVVLLGLETFLTLLAELGEVGEGDYGIVQVLEYLLLSMPQRAYTIFPMALLLGGLLGMGGLAQSGELVAMRASGVSLLRLVWAALKAGLVMTLLGVLLGEFLAPELAQKAEERRAVAKSESVAIRAGRGFWARDGDNFVHVRAVLPGVRLSRIRIFELGPEAELRSVTEAASARFEAGRWRLEGVSQSIIGPESVAGQVLETISWESVIDPGMLEVLATDPRDLSLRELLVYINYLKSNGLEPGPHQLAFWTKALGPISSLAMLFIAMPFVFAPQRTTTAGQRLVVGIFLGLLF